MKMNIMNIGLCDERSKMNSAVGLVYLIEFNVIILI